MMMGLCLVMLVNVMPVNVLPVNVMPLNVMQYIEEWTMHDKSLK